MGKAISGSHGAGSVHTVQFLLGGGFNHYYYYYCYCYYYYYYFCYYYYYYFPGQPQLNKHKKSGLENKKSATTSGTGDGAGDRDT